MKSDVISVFEVSPSEKLQLPKSKRPGMHARRHEANLLTNPASGLSWEKVQRRVRNRHGR